MPLSKSLSRLSPRLLGLVFFWVMFGGTLLVLGYVFIGGLRHRESEIRREVLGLAVAAAGLVEVELHEQLVRPEQLNGAEYQRVLRPLIRFHQQHPEIQYLWTTRTPATGGQLLVLETSTAPAIRTPQLARGRSQDILPFLGQDPGTEVGRASLPILKTGQAWIAPDFYSDTHGRYIEARAPLLDRDNRMVGYLGVDYALDSYFAQINEVRGTGGIALALALGVSLVVARTVSAMRRQTFLHLEQIQRAEAEMRVQRDLATKATAAKGELLAIATHDLKNPLTAIAGMAGLLVRMKKMPNPKTSAADELEMLGSIHSSAKHMGEIVRGILSNEGLEQGGVVFQPASTDLAALAREVVRFNAQSAERKRITLEAELPVALIVVADPKLLREAFDNYLSNAIKYSPADTCVRVSLRKLEGADEIEFAVHDAGPGLSEADQAELFQKFKKLTARPTGGETSTGLGLSIVKTIAERHHGRVGCESQLGQGARFWIRWPVNPPAPAAAETSVST
jgi:signal transduction histidine kinase